MVAFLAGGKTMNIVKQSIKYSFFCMWGGILIAVTWMNYCFSHLSVSSYCAFKLESMGASVEMVVQGSTWFPAVNFASIVLESSTCKERLYSYSVVLAQIKTPIGALRLNMPEIGDGDGLWETLPEVLWKVRYLDLSDTMIDDTVLQPLEGLSLDSKHQLETLNIKGTQISAEGIKKLQVLFPKCKIFHDGEYEYD